MVNPYLQIERLASDLRNQSLQAIEQGKSGRDSTGYKSAQPPTGYNATGNKAEDSLLAFGRWFLFCQRCRHGGHSSCITAWFNHHRLRNTGAAVNAQEVSICQLFIIIFAYFVVGCVLDLLSTHDIW